MENVRPEVIVASTLYLISGCILDPAPCACRIRAIVVHLERMMQMEGMDPVLRATAIQLHDSWVRLAEEVATPAGDSPEPRPLVH